MGYSLNRLGPPPPDNWPDAPAAPTPPPYAAPAPAAGFYPLTIGRTVSLALNLYRFGWRTFVAISLIAAIPVVAIQALVTAATYGATAEWQSRLLEEITATGRPPTDAFTTYPWQVIGLTLLVTIALGVIAFIGGAALIDAIASAIAGKPLSTRSSYGAAISRLKDLVGLYVVITVIGLGLTLFILIEPVLSLAAPGTLGNGGPLAFVGVIIGVAIVFLSVFLVLRLFLAVQALMIEGAPPATALRRSYSLVAGSMWRLIGYVLAFGLIVGLLGLVFIVLGSIIGLIISPPSFGGLTLTLNPTFVFVQSIITALCAQIFAPIVDIGMVLLYFDLRWRHGERVPVPGGGEAAGMPQVDMRRQI